MRKLTHIESWKSRNVLKLCDDLMNGGDKDNSPGEKDGAKSCSTQETEKSPSVLGVALPKPPPFAKLKESRVKKPMTKS